MFYVCKVYATTPFWSEEYRIAVLNNPRYGDRLTIDGEEYRVEDFIREARPDEDFDQILQCLGRELGVL